MKVTKSILWAGVVVLAAGGVARADEEPAPSFSKDVKPFLETYCVSCHNAKRARSGVNVEGYQALVNGKTKLVVAGKPDDSRLVAVMTGKSRPAMPPRKGGKQPKEDEIKKVKAWIEAGAKDDTDTERSAAPPPAPTAVAQEPAFEHPPVLASERRR